ncbi:hypothetical protein [Chitiniphilus shinanonensis]|uniref:hypothetical protein n=1 Tax=Chitiniphilus shinanonensis TaxID=553088 RepID=UPI003033A454
MTARRPLVLVNGRRQQLPAADRLPGAAVDLAGMATTSAAQVSPADSVEAAIGKLQGQLLIPAEQNAIINGEMVIAQRGTSFNAVTSGQYTLDRWRADSAGTPALVNITQSSDVPSNEFQYSLRATVATPDASMGAGDVFVITQVVEGYNARRFIGNTFVVGFWVRSAKTGVHCVALTNAGFDRSYVAEYTVSVANTWEFKQVVVAAGLITAGSWDWANGRGLTLRFTLMAGSSYQATPGAWQNGVFSGTTSQVNCLDAAGNVFAITGVQIRLGTVAIGFPRRHIGEEIILCERYFQKNYPLPITPGTTGRQISMSFCQNSYSLTLGHLPLRTRMRSGPTIVPYNDVTGATGTWRFRNSGTDRAVASVTSSEVHWEPTGNNGWSAGEYTYALYTAETEL